MSNIFLISDTHFGHKNILKFKRNDGNPLRPFSSVEEMDETLIENWNKVVKTQDKIYHLGDVTMSNNLKFISKLNGHKRLVRGNHDKASIKEYIKYFEEIYGVRQWENRFIMSHIPLHSDSLGRWKYNVHGHLHANNVPDERYINVSVEQINYTPIALEELFK